MRPPILPLTEEEKEKVAAAVNNLKEPRVFLT
jgi:hypothetical protein